MKELSAWTHAVTITFRKTIPSQYLGKAESIRRSAVFVNKVNRRAYGRRGMRRKGIRIASVAFWGDGAYEDHPHVHLAFQKPPHLTNADFGLLLHEVASTTKGLGKQFDIKPYRDEGWLSYMVDHGFDGWIEKLTFTAVCPKH
jgi:hypothetical protein